MSTPSLLLRDLIFPEGPRWHDGRLYFSDMEAREVVAVDLDGRRETIAEVPAQPSGLGWLPDGRMVIVSMHDRKLLRRERDGRLVEVADLGGIATFHCNDMVVDEKGRAYVGNFGFDLYGGGAPAMAKLALVDPDGGVRVVADELLFPNGMVLTPDGRTLIVAESGGLRLTAFDVAEADGSLSNRRVFAQLGAPPDGICLDAEGCVWVAHPMTPGECVRVAEGGEVRARIAGGDHGVFACMLGGDDGRTLFLAESKEHLDHAAVRGNGRIRVARVAAPHAGRP
jgi:sugar lactone lactonase YvrE